jgi:inhibitor of cysteine peptidase
MLIREAYPAVALALLFFPACLPILGPPPVSLTEADSSKTVVVEIGQQILVTLPANASTGYAWQLAELDPAILETTSQQYLPPSLPLPGAKGEERWEFTALSAGATQLRLVYLRPDDPPDTEPAQTFEIVVSVRAPGDTTTPAIDLELDEQSNGGAVIMPVAARLIVTLSSNASTGYQWELTGLDQTILGNTDQEYQPSVDNLPGAAGTQRWVFTALRTGETALNLEYRRSWDPPDTQPAATYTLAVTVYSSDQP